VELQSDGRIVVSGSQDWQVSRLNADGSLDTSFGGTGTIQISSTGNGSDLLIQHNDPNVPNDDKVVTIGFDDDATKLIIARLNNDGTFDSTWGGGAAVSMSSATLANRDTTRTNDNPSISLLDAAAVQQLLAELDANDTWTVKSRVRMRV
jgi:uncharacterized delta-60 repeat protein